MMMFFKTMIKRIGSYNQRHQYHEYFKKNVINNIGAKKREAAEKQWQYCTMNGTSHGGTDTQCIPVDLKPHHPAKILKKQPRCKIITMLSQRLINSSSGW